MSIILPDIWGQGQLFAFSALDGKSLWSDDFVGVLSGDRVGIRFYSKVKRELAIVNLSKQKPVFTAVTGDLIGMSLDAEKEINIIYADTHLIIGNTVSNAQAVVLTEGKYSAEHVGEIEIQDTFDGEFTAFLCESDRFAFAFGKRFLRVTRDFFLGAGITVAKPTVNYTLGLLHPI